MRVRLIPFVAAVATFVAPPLVGALHASEEPPSVLTPARAELPRPAAEDLCIDDLVASPSVTPDLGIPVGCDLADCCPGCTEDMPIDWHVRLEGDAADLVELSLAFDNLPAEYAAALQVEGDGRWDGVGTFDLEGSNAILRNFAGTDGQPPVANIILDFDEDGLERIAARARVEDLTSAGHVTVVVEQVRGGHVVNDTRLDYGLTPCGAARVQANDRIQLIDNFFNDVALIFMDAQRGGCTNDEVYYTNAIVDVGNVFANGECNNEIVVFSIDDGMALRSNPPWTNTLGDLLSINMPNRINSNIKRWIAMPSSQVPVTQTRSTTELSTAEVIYNYNRTGISFASSLSTPPAIIGSTTTINKFGSTAQAMIDETTTCTASASVFTASSYHTPGRLNVYYVNKPFTGFFCPGTNLIVIGTGAKVETLAHEIGHAYTLAHSTSSDYNNDSVLDFPLTNIMNGGGSGRNSFRGGQAFRMNLNPGSRLNMNGERSGSTRQCWDSTISNTCPWAALGN